MSPFQTGALTKGPLLLCLIVRNTFPTIPISKLFSTPLSLSVEKSYESKEKSLAHALIKGLILMTVVLAIGDMWVISPTPI